MKVLLALLVILCVSGVLCDAVLEPCRRGGSKKKGLYLAKLKKNLPDSTVLFVARKLAASNLRSVAMARQVSLTFPEFGREFQRGMDIQFGCCIFGMFRGDTVEKVLCYIQICIYRAIMACMYELDLWAVAVVLILKRDYT